MENDLSYNKSTKIYETQIKIKKAKKELSKNIIKIKEDSLYMNKFENLIDDKKKDYINTKIYTRIAPKSKIKQIKTIKWENLFIF